MKREGVEVVKRCEGGRRFKMLLGGGKININYLITLGQNRPIENSYYNYRIINKQHWRSGINSNNLIHIKTKNTPKSSMVFGNINLHSVRNKSSVFIDTVLTDNMILSRSQNPGYQKIIIFYVFK